MSIYSNLKLGHKVAIGTEINQSCRNFVFTHGWDQVDDTALQDIFDTVYKRNYFIRLAVESADNKNDVEEFQEVIYEKIVDGFSKFGKQKATAKQVYYYVGLCNELCEEPETITNNKEIQIEISRLIKLKEAKENVIEAS